LSESNSHTAGGDPQKVLTRKRTKGTPLKVFSGKEASLNRVILQILLQKGDMISYDTWLSITKIKGFRHVDIKTVYRRIDALEEQGWIAKKGSRKTRPGWTSNIHKITLKGQIALKLDQKDIEEFLNNATKQQLLKFLDVLSSI
jgi:DNA-binding MarR family transcriptional regulator